MMFAKLIQGQLGELLAPTSPQHQLHQAIEQHQNEQAMRLIHEGMHFNAPDPARDDALPIHTACKAGNMAMVEALVGMGADVNARDRSGNGPLHYAAKAGKMDLVKHLLGIGADVGKRNNYRQTAYDVATSHVVRQYLLPLQLRAEPEPAPGTMAAIHNPDIIRDYSNLPPPPTVPAFAPPVAAPPSGGGGGGMPPPAPGVGGAAYPKPGGSWVDPAVTRPIAADGFHCSVGNPELAAKYGHIKQDIQIAPPPKLPGADGAAASGAAAATGSGGPRPQANPSQYSAFAAYGGRPPPRYVSYNAVSNSSAPFVPPTAAAVPQPYQQQPQPQYQVMQPMQQQPVAAVPAYPGGTGSNTASPIPPAPASYGSSGYAPSPPLAPPAPQQLSHSPPPPVPQPGAAGSPLPPGGARASPLPPPPPLPALPAGMRQQQQFSPPPPPMAPSVPPGPSPQRPASAVTAAPPPPQQAMGGIPTLPAPNTISVFQPDSGDDAIALDK